MDYLHEDEPGKESKIQSLLSLAPYLRAMLGEEYGLALADLHKYLYVTHGKKLTVPVKVGDPIKKGGITETAMMSESREVRRIPKEVMGIPYVGLGIPVTEDDGSIAGTITITYPIETQEKIITMAEALNSFTQQISDSINELQNTSEQLAITAQDLEKNTSGINKDINEMDMVIALIKEVSDQTHLLGLNAAIESARAGNYGRGFNVVAGEIRKLAAKTNNSVKGVNERLSKIRETILNFTMEIHQISAVSQQQAASTEEITGSIKKIETMVEELAQISEDLVDL
ncbi:methyl-accepting chemotaxis protein [Desulfoscipio sp. XC116]|uniref:methyl-accepting chemotaxis protein n=1 Tax=Desulfoscipio sp. XC116 TaxID=3144975 RepID=UPI00325BB0C7